MGKNLVVVESPAKAKTIEKYLGPDFTVLASYGHVRDIPSKSGAILPEDGFAMHYQLIEKNKKHVDAIRKALKKAEALYLAPDLDREGEAIAWHIYEILQEQGALKNKSVYRIVFNAITKSAIADAVQHPRSINMHLVNAQQARRALDYLVGFTLSPLLWKKVRRGLSAGRVQSPALRLIVEREQEIQAFVPQEYWSVVAHCQHDTQAFEAKLTRYAGEKVEQFTVTQAEQAAEIEQALLRAASGKLHVDKVVKKQRNRHPAAPFITSTLQQEAARKLGFTARRTMGAAQQLYESGLITYMRTDSVHLVGEAIADIRTHIAKTYGDENVPDKPRVYKSKSKNAQEAHEAIRPTSMSNLPEKMQKLSAEQRKLYDLIWKRTVASQMVPAVLDTVAVDLSCGEGNTFRANGSVVRHPGFMAVYLEGKDDVQTDDADKILPALSEGDTVDLLKVLTTQHFTEPPPRYSEASLVKALEEYGIGRPSTYASIISTLQQRDYVELIQKRFHPTDVGCVVNRFLTEYFTQYVDYNFTAHLEDDLDAISRGEKSWVPLLGDFWAPFKQKIDDVESHVKRSDVTQEQLDETCPECGKPLSVRLGARGRFIGCTGYPDCKYTRNLGDDSEEGTSTPEVVADRVCPKCGAPLYVRMGRYGKFIGCSAYPKCKHIESLEQPSDTKVRCPECHKGTMLQRKSRRGKVFYSCSCYPDCKYAVWNEPLDAVCPKCRWPMMTLKTTKRRGTEKVCPQKTCGHVEKA